MAAHYFITFYLFWTEIVCPLPKESCSIIHLGFEASPVFPRQPGALSIGAQKFNPLTPLSPALFAHHVPACVSDHLLQGMAKQQVVFEQLQWKHRNSFIGMYLVR